MNLFKNKLFRLIGIITILYFGLFREDNPEGLRNRLSPENIKSGIKEVRKKSSHVVQAMKQAKELEEKQKFIDSYYQNKASNRFDIKVQDMVIGEGKEVECGNWVSVDYRVFINNAALLKLNSFNDKQFIFGDKNGDKVVANEVKGMRKGGVRKVIIPANYQAQDERLAEYLAQAEENGIAYEIKLNELEIVANGKNYRCDFDDL